MKNAQYFEVAKMKIHVSYSEYEMCASELVGSRLPEVIPLHRSPIVQFLTRDCLILGSYSSYFLKIKNLNPSSKYLFVMAEHSCGKNRFSQRLYRLSICLRFYEAWLHSYYFFRSLRTAGCIVKTIICGFYETWYKDMADIDTTPKAISPEQNVILSMLYGAWQNRCLSLVVEFKIPELLCKSDKPSISIDEIATDTGCKTSTQLYPIMRVLAQWGIGTD